MNEQLILMNKILDMSKNNVSEGEYIKIADLLMKLPKIGEKILEINFKYYKNFDYINTYTFNISTYENIENEDFLFNINYSNGTKHIYIGDIIYFIKCFQKNEILNMLTVQYEVDIISYFPKLRVITINFEDLQTKKIIDKILPDKKNLESVYSQFAEKVSTCIEDILNLYTCLQ